MRCMDVGAYFNYDWDIKLGPHHHGMNLQYRTQMAWHNHSTYYPSFLNAYTDTATLLAQALMVRLWGTLFYTCMKVRWAIMAYCRVLKSYSISYNASGFRHELVFNYHCQEISMIVAGLSLWQSQVMQRQLYIGIFQAHHVKYQKVFHVLWSV